MGLKGKRNLKVSTILISVIHNVIKIGIVVNNTDIYSILFCNKDQSVY